MRARRLLCQCLECSACWLGMAVLSAYLLVSDAFAGGSAASFSVAEATSNPGETVTLGLTVAGAVDLTGFGFDVLYDASRVS